MPEKIPREDLIEDIIRVYQKIGSVPSENKYREHGNYSVSAVRREFGKYTAGREAADLPERDLRGGQNKIEREDLIDELQRLGNEVGGTPTREDMQEKGKYAEQPYRTEFGDWSTALLEAGYDYDELNRPGSDVADRVTIECTTCGAEQERLRSQLKNQRNVFCSTDCLHEWRSTEFTGDDHPLTDYVEVECDACGETKREIPSVAAVREYNFCDYDCFGDWASENRSGEDAPAWEGGGHHYRGPNWESQKRKALERDGYECCRCDCTEEDHFQQYGRQLSVHHIKPVREFYADIPDGDWPDFEVMNALDNLVTLCQSCHKTIESLPLRPQFN
jgi:5-methylcytosine-specific restriction endonuclease McrA